MIISFLVMLFLNGGGSGHPRLPQMTNEVRIDGGTMNRLKGMTINDDLKAGKGQI